MQSCVTCVLSDEANMHGMAVIMFLLHEVE